MFELNFKDERYLPFEGAGVISRWRLELPTAWRQFDYDTIADIVIHVRYTSVEGGNSLRREAEKSITEFIQNVEQVSKDEGLFAMFDLKRDFPAQWRKLLDGNAASIEITGAHFPFVFNGKDLAMTESSVFLRGKSNQDITPPAVNFDLEGNALSVGPWAIDQDASLTKSDIDVDGSPFGTWTIDLSGTIDPNLDDMFLAIKYAVSP